MIHLTPEQEAACIRYNPFEEPEDPDDRILRDCMQTARKPGPCIICFETIQPGERTRRQSGIVNRRRSSCRMCAECCVAMASSWTDAGAAIEKRTSMGIARARKRG